MSEKKFPDAVLSEANELEFDKGLLNKREVVEGCTIDAAASKDLDDAFALIPNGNTYLLQISITDVTTLIPKDSAIIGEALQRVQTQYFKHRTVPMLPPILSENKLSLLANQFRPAITFELEITPEGDVCNFTIKETMFRNRRRLSYAGFDRIVKTRKDDPDYEMFTQCTQLAQRLLENRRARGALAIYDLKRRLFTTEEGILLPLDKKRAHLGNIVVQEFMILVNQETAALLATEHIPILFRNHIATPNVPGREEIIKQFNAALQHPHLLLALSQRSTLWFQKAKYEPVLKGHFGLNLAAYTHVTSPLRRVPDLINHFQLKKILTGEVSGFEQDELIEISDTINRKITQIRETRREAFKEIARREAKLRLEGGTIEELLKLSSGDFKKILKEAFHHNMFDKKLLTAIERRLLDQKLDANHLLLLLFPPENDIENRQTLLTLVMDFLNAHPEHAKEVLHLAEQNHLIDMFRMEIQEFQLGYIARSVGVIEGKEVSTPEYAYANNKKEAGHRASLLFLEMMLSKQLVPVTQTRYPTPDELMETPTPSVEMLPSENYVGKLLEICSRQTGWQTPDYQFDQKGPSHHPVFICNARLETPQEILTATATATTKKGTKQIAAKKILNLIEEKGLLQKDEEEHPALNVSAEFVPQQNYVSQLQETCLKMRWEIPEYRFAQTGPSHAPNFHCTVAVKMFENIGEFHGRGRSKKEAKQRAAFQCLKNFAENPKFFSGE